MSLVIIYPIYWLKTFFIAFGMAVTFPLAIWLRRSSSRSTNREAVVVPPSYGCRTEKAGGVKKHSRHLQPHPEVLREFKVNLFALRGRNVQTRVSRFLPLSDSLQIDKAACVTGRSRGKQTQHRDGVRVAERLLNLFSPLSLSLFVFLQMRLGNTLISSFVLADRLISTATFSHLLCKHHNTSCDWNVRDIAVVWQNLFSIHIVILLWFKKHWTTFYKTIYASDNDSQLFRQRQFLRRFKHEFAFPRWSPALAFQQFDCRTGAHHSVTLRC